MNEFTIIEFKVTDKYFGYPQPFIPNGYIVLLIQDGKVEISKYNEPTDDNPIPSFDHPKDLPVNKELENRLLNTIKQRYPQYLTLDEAVILTCPNDVLEKIIW